MIEVARVTAGSSAAPEQYYARWCDVATHPEWAPGMEFIRLDGPLVVGARGVMRTRAGQEAPYIVSDLVPGVVFEDTVVLDGAELVVRHQSLPRGTGSRLELRAHLKGPRAAERAGDLAGLQEALETDLAGLVALVERTPSGG